MSLENIIWFGVDEGVYEPYWIGRGETLTQKH